MIPQRKNFAIYQGQTFRDRLLIVDDQRLPIDLSSMQARMQVRPEISSDEVLIELTTENGGISLGSDGILAFSFSAQDTAALRQGVFEVQTWVYDLELVTPAADPIVDRIAEGVVVFYPEVTR